MALMFWVPHDTHVWLPGTKVSDGRYKTEQGEVSVAADQEKKLENIADKFALDGIDDVCMLSAVSDAALLHTLRVRYGQDKIYTNISCILVSLNPLKNINIYSSEQIQMYNSTHDIASLPPHIYGLSAYAFKHLIDSQKSQAILISGESGAGKTENTKFVLSYISEILRSQAGLADRLLEVNPILETFGNAKTVRNNNSSRFGKWIEVIVNPATMSLVGASVTDYLLEVTRVCSQGPNERNYHIFYQLTTNAAQDAFPNLKLGCDYSKFNYIKRNSAKVDGIDDTQEFQQLRDAMSAMKFSVEEEENIFRIVAGLLHLGNFEFAPDGDGSKIKTADALANAAEVLGVNAEDLSKASLFKRIQTGRETMMSPLDPEKAVLQRDSISKLIYGRLFKMLVSRCNDVLQSVAEGSAAAGIFYGVLDIAGFEFFETNYLEQLFINLSNEKLQQFFNNSVFKKELKEYEDEGIPVANITYVDNVDVLNLIEGKQGLLLMLDDATMGVKQTDLQYVTKVLKDHDKNPHFFKPKYVKDAPLNFGVKHYAGDVMYTADAIITKNVATQPPEVVELMCSSSLDVLKGLADREGEQKAGQVKIKTVGAGFRKSLATLIDKLNASEAHFVRCVKPNKEKKPGIFDAVMIVDQLRLSGVTETVKIRKSGFLMRPPALEFLQRFLILLDRDTKKQVCRGAGSSKDSHAMPGTDLVKCSKALIAEMPSRVENFKNEEIVVGKTKVFIKAELYRYLEEARREAFIPPTMLIQRIWRGHRTRVIMKEVLEINAALKKLSAEAGAEVGLKAVELVRKDLKRATIVEGKLATMDALLERAVSLPIKLPSLPTYMKARASMAAQAVLARELSNCQTSISLPWIQAHVARALAFNMQGELIDGLKTRCLTLEDHLGQRRALQNCVYSEVMEDVQKVIAEADGFGLSKPETWLLPNGPDMYSAAVKRKEQLIEEQKQKEAAIKDIDTQVRSLASKLETTEMQSLLFRSMSYNMRGELIEALDAYVKAASRLKQFKDGDAANQASGSVSLEEIKPKVEEAKTSLDLPLMQAILERAGQAGMSEGELKPLKDRCEGLEKQSVLRRELQSCALCEDFAVVSKSIAAAEELGLQDASKWLLEDGHRLLQRATSQKEELQRIETLKEMISKAAVQYDAPTMQSSLNEASELGVAMDQFAESHEVFLKLQSHDFVEATSGDLREKGGSDPATLQKITNLTAQLERLGYKVDSAGMQEVAQDMLAPKRGAKKKKTALMPSPFDSKDATEVATAMKVFGDLANLSALRDPLTWGKSGLGGEDDEISADPSQIRKLMLEYTGDDISMSLTELSSELGQAAITNFRDVQRCMGDKPSTYKGDLKEPILANAKKGDKALVDEIYVQVMKQMTNNPSSRSTTAGWELLKQLCQDVRPSRDVGEFLRGFLVKRSEPSTSASPDGKEEKRLVDGTPYTKAEFIDYFGEAEGQKQWDLAQPEEGEEKKERAKSHLAVAESRTRDRSATVLNFQATVDPAMAADTLKIFLSNK